MMKNIFKRNNVSENDASTMDDALSRQMDAIIEDIRVASDDGVRVDIYVKLKGENEMLLDTTYDALQLWGCEKFIGNKLKYLYNDNVFTDFPGKNLISLLKRVLVDGEGEAGGEECCGIIRYFPGSCSNLIDTTVDMIRDELFPSGILDTTILEKLNNSIYNFHVNQTDGYIYSSIASLRRIYYWDKSYVDAKNAHRYPELFRPFMRVLI